MNLREYPKRPSSPAPSRLLNRREAAKYLGVSERTIFTMIQERGLPVVELGARCKKFDIADLDLFIERCKKGVRSPVESEVQSESR